VDADHDHIDRKTHPLKLSMSIRPRLEPQFTRPVRRSYLSRQIRYKSLVEGEALKLTLIPYVYSE
jgi:hypothetical protein